MSTGIYQRTGTTGEPTCCCPACSPLSCLERPRFFTGMLLTEAELNSEQAYVIAKGRLRNRHLFGWGIVCGLDVEISHCPGFVTVSRGYALDPCGNDVVVCRDDALDVIAAIRACDRARRQASRVPCDPLRPAPVEPDCGQVQRWCLTLRYVEVEGRPTVALRNPPQRTGTTAPAAAPAADPFLGAPKTLTPVAAPVACEPTRVVEGYRLEVMPAGPDACPGLLDQVRETAAVRMGRCLARLQDALGADRVSQVLLGSVAEVTADEQRAAVGVLEALQAEAAASLARRPRPTVHGLLSAPPERRRPGPALPPRLPADAPATVPAAPLANVLIEHLTWWAACACDCPPDPCDDRVVLACLTVDVGAGAILEVQQSGCRRSVAGACGRVDPCLDALGLLLERPPAPPVAEQLAAQARSLAALEARVAKLDEALRAHQTEPGPPAPGRGPDA